MIGKTQPIQLPIDPNKTYVTRNGLIISNIEIGGNTRFACAIPLPPVAKYYIDMRDGKSCYPHIEALDLVAELVEDEQHKTPNWCKTTDLKVMIDRLASAATRAMSTNCNGNMYVSPAEFRPLALDIFEAFTPDERTKTQSRDWSDVIRKLLKITNIDPKWSNAAIFREQALAILQEFDARNTPRDYTEVVDLIYETMRGRRDSEFKLIALPILQEFDAQNQPAVKESLTTEPCNCNQLLSNPADYCQECQEKITSGWVDGESDLEKMAKAGDMRVEVKFKHKAPIEELDLVIGEMYEMNGRCGNEIGKLIAFHDTEYVVLEEERGFVIYEEREFIRKHTPKPVEREIEWWVNVYADSFEPCVHFSKDEADTGADEGRVACLHIKRTFFVGEGL